MSHILQILNIPGTIDGSTWRPPVKVINIASTTLPTGTSVTIDGVTLVNGDRVLFTALTDSALNNKVYRLTGVGTALVWTLQTDAHEDGVAEDGDLIFVQSGTVYSDTIWFFTGSIWKLYTFSIPLQQNLLFSPDATFDIGAVSSGRPKDMFLARDLVVGRHILNEVDGAGNIGASGATRFNKLFLKNQAVLGLASQATGSFAALWAGDHANITSVIGSDASGGFMGFYQAGTPVIWQNDMTDLGMKFISGSNLNLSLLGSGAIQLERSSGANILWTTDGAGNIGSLTNRPNQGFFKTKLVSPLLESFSGTDLTLNASGSNLLLQIGGVSALKVDSSKNLQFLSSGNLFWSSDGSGTIGASGANRPDEVHIKTRVHINEAAIASAALSVAATDKGFLPPRMTKSQRDGISAPASGLIIFNTDSKSINLYSGPDHGWEDLGPEAFYSVMDFGAIGDGSTDDTVAIQATITAAESVGIGNGAVVYFPTTRNGYKITGTLTVSNDTRLVGDGGFSSNIKYYGATAAPMILVTDGPSRFEISNISLNNYGSATIALQINCTKAFINGIFSNSPVKFSEAVISTFQPADYNYFTVIKNCYLSVSDMGQETPIGIYFGGGHTQVVESTMLTGFITGIKFGPDGLGGYVLGASVTNSHIESFAGLASGYPGALDAVGIYADKVIGLNISGNNFQMNGTAEPTAEPQRDITLAEVKGANISGNNFFHTGHGSAISLTSAAATGILIQGNSFWNLDLGVEVLASADYEVGTNDASSSTLLTNEYISRLTASRAAAIDSSKRLISSSATLVELNYLSGVTSLVQTQLNSKAPIANPTFTGAVLLPDGTESLPGLAFALAPGTGLYRTGATSFGISSNGSQIANFADSQIRMVGSIAAPFNIKSSIPNSTSLQFYQDGSDNGVIRNTSSSGSLLFGTDSTTRLEINNVGGTKLSTTTGFGINADPSSINIFLARRDQDGLLRGILTNGSTGSSASVMFSLSSGAGDLNIQATSIANGALGYIATDSTFTGGLRIATNGTNPLEFRTNNNSALIFDGTSQRATFYASLITPGAEITGSNSLLWSSDGGGNIGASGANRPDKIYVKSQVIIGSYVLDSSELGYLDDTEALTTFTLVDNTSSAATVAQWAVASFNSIHIEYSISRGAGIRESGSIRLSSDGTSVAISQGGIASIGSSGITFDVDLSSGNIRLRYTSTNTGSDATLKYKVQKWSSV